MPSHNINQIELVCKVVEYLEERHGIESLNCRQYNAVIAACTSIVNELAKPDKPVVPDMGYRAWLDCDHTGMSSEFMGRVLYADGKYPKSHYCVEYGDGLYPRDADDFGRCVGLLIAVPVFRERLQFLKEAGPEWAAIAEHWDELEELHERGQVKELNARIAELYSREAVEA